MVSQTAGHSTIQTAFPDKWFHHIQAGTEIHPQWEQSSAEEEYLSVFIYLLVTGSSLLSKGAFTNPLFSLPQPILEYLGYRRTKDWTTCSTEVAIRPSCVQGGASLLTSAFSYSKQPSFRAHQPLCPMNQAWGSQPLVFKADNSRVVPWWLQVTGSRLALEQSAG